MNQKQNTGSQESDKKSLGRWISILYRYGLVTLGKNAKKYNIGPGQISILLIMTHTDGISQEEIKTLMGGMDKGTTSRMIKSLIQNGYLKKTVSPNDKRANLIYKTPKFKKIEEKLVDISHSWDKALTRGFSSEERKTLELLVGKMISNAMIHVHIEE